MIRDTFVSKPLGIKKELEIFHVNFHDTYISVVSKAINGVTSHGQSANILESGRERFLPL